jgi:hypothetical protein
MAYYLWQLLRDAYAELGQLTIAAATGGSTTTVVDSKLTGTGRDDLTADDLLAVVGQVLAAATLAYNLLRAE